MRTYKFCLSCQTWEAVETDQNCEGHIVYYPPFRDEPADVDFCGGPFTFSEPPENLDEYWEAVFGNEPTQDEISEMNENVE